MLCKHACLLQALQLNAAFCLLCLPAAPRLANRDLTAVWHGLSKQLSSLVNSKTGLTCRHTEANKGGAELSTQPSTHLWS